MVVFEVCHLVHGAFPLHHVARNYYQNKKLPPLPFDMHVGAYIYNYFWVCECKANYFPFLIRAFAKFQGVLPRI
jgi:hypothetical protein